MFPGVALVIGTRRKCDACGEFNAEGCAPMHVLGVALASGQYATLDDIVRDQYTRSVTATDWTCSNCSRRVTSHVYTRVLSSGEAYADSQSGELREAPWAPTVLEVHIVRDRDCDGLPVTTPLQFLEEWQPAVFPGSTYDLFSAILHFAGDVGHYTAVGRVAVNRDASTSWWIEHDSVRTARLDLHSDKTSKHVSVLFYRLRTSPSLPPPVASPPCVGLGWHDNNCYINAAVTALAYAHYNPRRRE